MNRNKYLYTILLFLLLLPVGHALAARHHRIPIGDASRITDAKSALLNPSRGTSLAKTAPLLKPLIALGALTRE